MTGAEVQDEYQKKLGPEFGQIFYKLEVEIVYLYKKWKEYEELFGGSQTQLQKLNAFAGNFWATIKGLMWQDILLTLCRLTDPPGNSGGRQDTRTLTIRRLPKLCEEHIVRRSVEETFDSPAAANTFAAALLKKYAAQVDVSTAIWPETAQPLESASRAKIEQALQSLDVIKRTVEIATEATEFARPLRNEYIAHKDLARAVWPETITPLEPGSKHKVERAVQSLHTVRNAILDRLLNYATTEERHFAYPPSAGAVLAELEMLIRIGVRFVTLVNGKDSTDNVVNIERACEFLSQNGWSTMHACDTAYALREFSEKFIQFRDDERMD